MAKQSDTTGNKEALAKRVTPQTRRTLQSQIKEQKLLREEEKARKAAAAAAAEEAKMDVDILDDNEQEAAYLREQARLAAEAQARLDAERHEQGGMVNDRVPTGGEVEDAGGSGENGGSEGGGTDAVEMDIEAGPTGGSDEVEAEGGSRGEEGEATGRDVFDGDINRHLAELNMKGGVSESPAPIDLETKSPAKKKSRSRAPSTPGLPRSILKTTPHDHVNKRVILEANVVLTGANTFLQPPPPPSHLLTTKYHTILDTQRRSQTKRSLMMRTVRRVFVMYVGGPFINSPARRPSGYTLAVTRSLDD